ncbi:MAG: methyltransferase domain-containing protein [Terrimicrobiaceae bacterium]
MLSLATFNASRRRLLLANTAFAETIPAGALVLDAGAGDAPYRGLFAHARYESADFLGSDRKYAKPTYECDLASIPVEDTRFDFVIFNQVMEHLPEPAAVRAELFRVLKPSGKLIYTGPLFFEEHEQPYDFYRYTRFGVRHLFEKAGFEVERLDWLEGFFGTAGYGLSAIARFLPRTPSEMPGAGLLAWALCPAIWILKAAFWILSIVFQHLEPHVKCTARGFPKNYVAVLVKPALTHSMANV